MTLDSEDVTTGSTMRSASDGTQQPMKIVWPLIVIILEVLILAVIIAIHEYVQKRNKSKGAQEKSVLADTHAFLRLEF
jgi:hypothetical protein